MNLSERIEKRKNRILNKERVAILILLFTTIFFATTSYMHKDRLDVLKSKVITYDYENGSKGIKDIAKNI